MLLSLLSQGEWNSLLQKVQCHGSWQHEWLLNLMDIKWIREDWFKLDRSPMCIFRRMENPFSAAALELEIFSGGLVGF